MGGCVFQPVINKCLSLTNIQSAKEEGVQKVMNRGLSKLSVRLNQAPAPSPITFPKLDEIFAQTPLNKLRGMSNVVV
jgi:hypothetical protein